MKPFSLFRSAITVCGLTSMMMITGCSANTEGSLAYLWKREKFKPNFMREAIFTGMPGKGDNDSFSEGFKQGCRNTTANIGQSTWRLQKITVDGYRLTQDPWYLRGYVDATAYCTHMLDWDVH